MAKAKSAEKPSDQEVQNQMLDRYEKLNQLWREAEESVKKFLVAKEVTHIFAQYETGDESNPVTAQHCIAWARAKGSYRLCHGYAQGNDEFQFTPILDSNLAIRMECIPHFVELRRMVIETAQAAIPEMDDAIDKLSRVLAYLK